jgi:hypothetical protein
MAQQGKTTLKGYFNTGDVPTEAQFADFIDSYHNLTDDGAFGTAAFTAATDYATEAQGDLADTAVQPGDLATVATSGSYGDLSGTPDLTGFVESDPTGVTGADAITNVISLTQAEYDAIGAPNAATLYVVTA